MTHSFPTRRAADLRRNQVGDIVTFRNVTAATRMARELSYHANHDALTGLLNRRVLEARLERALASADELDCRHALIYFDLDHFKAINDSAGHVAGDELLRQLALLLRRQLRERSEEHTSELQSLMRSSY